MPTVTATQAPLTGQTLQVWDPLVRVFHWSLVLTFFTAYFTGEENESLHAWAGYAVLALILVRIVWGFVGTHYARFSDFVCSPRETLAYFKVIFSRHVPRYIGHNPAGALMILVLLGSLLITTVSGLAVYGLEGEGPLASWLVGMGESAEEVWEEVHEVFANLTLLLVAFHIAGVVLGSVMHRENLVRAMITGRKRV